MEEEYPYHLGNVNSSLQSPGYSGADFVEQVNWAEVFDKIDKHDDYLYKRSELESGNKAIQDVFAKVAAQEQGDLDALNYFNESGISAPSELTPNPAMRIRNRGYKMLEALGQMDTRNISQDNVQRLLTKYADLLSKPDEELLRSQERRENSLALQNLRGTQRLDQIGTTYDKKGDLLERAAAIKASIPPSTIQGVLVQEVLGGRMSIEEAATMGKGTLMQGKDGKMYRVVAGIPHDLETGEPVAQVPGGLRSQTQADPAPKTPQLLRVGGRLVPWTPGTPVPPGAELPGENRRAERDQASDQKWAQGQAAEDLRKNLSMMNRPEAEQMDFLNRRTQFHLDKLQGGGGIEGGALAPAAATPWSPVPPNPFVMDGQGNREDVDPKSQAAAILAKRGYKYNPTTKRYEKVKAR